MLIAPEMRRIKNAMTMLMLYRRVPELNMQRFYELELCPDLFGVPCLRRRWGRIGRYGKMQETPYPTEKDAAAALKKLLAKKERKGYVLEKGVGLEKVLPCTK